MNSPQHRRLLSAVPFSPRVLPALKQWLRADSSVYLTNALATPAQADGDLVGGWLDLSGVGKAATIIDAKRPTLKIGANGIGNCAALLFSGGQVLQTAAFTVALAQPTTIYAVYQFTDTLAQYAVVDGITNGHRNLFANQSTPTQYFINAGNSVNSAAGQVNIAPHIATALFNGAGSQLWIDGVSKAAGDAGANDLTGLTIGAAYTAGVLYFKGLIAEVLIYSAVHSDAQRLAVQTYLSRRYKITLA